MYDYDEIDRALFALPLEQPPAGLRESILAVTVHAPRPRPVVASIGVWESVGLGLAFAAMTTIVIAILTNAPIGHQAQAAAGVLVRTISSPATLLWLGVGAAAAFWASLPTFRPARNPARTNTA